MSNLIIELTKLHDKIGELRSQAMIDNVTNNPMVDAYNDGIEAMTNQVLHYINEIGVEKAFGGVQ